jgi:hypothetical protein
MTIMSINYKHEQTQPLPPDSLTNTTYKHAGMKHNIKFQKTTFVGATLMTSQVAGTINQFSVC